MAAPSPGRSKAGAGSGAGGLRHTSETRFRFDAQHKRPEPLTNTHPPGSHMSHFARGSVSAAVSFVLAVAAAQAADNGGSPALTMTPLDSFKTGGAEIVA